MRSRDIGSQFGASLKSLIDGELKGVTKALIDGRHVSRWLVRGLRGLRRVRRNRSDRFLIRPLPPDGQVRRRMRPPAPDLLHGALLSELP